MSDKNRSPDRADPHKARSESSKAGQGAYAPKSAPPPTPTARNKPHDRNVDNEADTDIGQDHDEMT